MEGEPEAVMDYYNALLADHQAVTVKLSATDDGKYQISSGTGEALIKTVTLFDEDGEELDIVRVGQPVRLHVAILCQQHIPELVVGFMIKDRLGQPVFGINTHHMKRQMYDLVAGVDASVIFGFPANIGPGSYSIAIALHSGGTHVVNNYHWLDMALVFTVVNAHESEFVGMAWLPVTMEEAA